MFCVICKLSFCKVPCSRHRAGVCCEQKKKDRSNYPKARKVRLLYERKMGRFYKETRRNLEVY